MPRELWLFRPQDRKAMRIACSVACDPFQKPKRIRAIASDGPSIFDVLGMLIRVAYLCRRQTTAIIPNMPKARRAMADGSGTACAVPVPPIDRAFT
jgi:hypothetical protein